MAPGRPGLGWACSLGWFGLWVRLQAGFSGSGFEWWLQSTLCLPPCVQLGALTPWRARSRAMRAKISVHSLCCSPPFACPQLKRVAPCPLMGQKGKEKQMQTTHSRTLGPSCANPWEATHYTTFSLEHVPYPADAPSSEASHPWRKAGQHHTFCLKHVSCPARAPSSDASHPWRKAGPRSRPCACGCVCVVCACRWKAKHKLLQ